MSDKQVPYAWAVSGSSRLYDEYDAKSEAKRCGGSTEAFPLYRQGVQPLPDCRVGDASFMWDGERQVHIPMLTLTFEPVPINSPCNAKGWADRDRMAALLAASSAPKEG